MERHALTWSGIWNDTLVQSDQHSYSLCSFVMTFFRWLSRCLYTAAGCPDLLTIMQVSLNGSLIIYGASSRKIFVPSFRLCPCPVKLFPQGVNDTCTMKLSSEWHASKATMLIGHIIALMTTKEADRTAYYLLCQLRHYEQQWRKRKWDRWRKTWP